MFGRIVASSSCLIESSFVQASSDTEICLALSCFTHVESDRESVRLRSNVFFVSR